MVDPVETAASCGSKKLFDVAAMGLITACAGLEWGRSVTGSKLSLASCE